MGYGRFGKEVDWITGREAAHSLISLRQGQQTVMDYAVEFRTLTVDSG